MSSSGTRQRYTEEYRVVGGYIKVADFLTANGFIPVTKSKQNTGKQITVSESHAMDRKTGAYRAGGPFFTSRITHFKYPGYTDAAYNASSAKLYRGPVTGLAPSIEERSLLGDKTISDEFGDKNESQLLIDGTNAISQSNPINPASQLGNSMSETYLEGLPSIPGMQLWKDKTRALKALGSEYLNYQFGWAPLRDEVTSVRDAARNHRDLLSQYHRGEGSSTHRRFDFPSQTTVSSLPVTSPNVWGGLPFNWTSKLGTRQISLVRENKKWFEGCFTYGLPSSTDSWRRALGFGSDADQLFGIALSPSVLWELTPWSWAIDWFSNAGDVINNITNFGLAGLVLRYGYIMEESIERVVAEGSGPGLTVGSIGNNANGTHFLKLKNEVPSGTYANGTECVTKRRYPASPFGFSIGWEDLSPTQLAITAALGISRLL